MTFAENMPIDWSALWKKEDWWAVWLGFIILATAAAGVFKWIPRLRAWTTDVTKALPTGAEYFIVLLIALLALTLIGIAAMKENVKLYALGFPVIFFLAFVSLLIPAQPTIGKDLGLEFALWALVLGLLISNTVGTPKWLKPAVKTELFIKIGLVLLGAEILFYKILAAGAYGMLQALIVVSTVFYFCYLLSTRVFKLDRAFASILATGVSICGVSAAIAAGGAIKGDSKYVSYTISLVLLLAIPMLVFMPVIAKIAVMPDAVAGAWLGGTIDTTPAVVAAGALYSKIAMDVAAIVKLSQNVLIGLWAFGLALYFTMKVERKPEEAKPSAMEIWYRFPKFILGFLIASLVFSLILVPVMGAKPVDSVTGLTGGIRAWWFAIAFVSIGLDTRFAELVKTGKGKPFASFTISQIFNIFLTLILAYAIFGGIFFPKPY